MASAGWAWPPVRLRGVERRFGHFAFVGLSPSLEFPLVPQFQTARGKRFGRTVGGPKTDAGDYREAIAADTKVSNDIEKVGHGRP